MADPDTTQHAATPYQLTITTSGETVIRHITAHPDALAQEVHRHARGLLGGSGLTITLTGLTGTAHRGTAHIADLALTPADESHAATSHDHMWGYTLTDLDRMARAACTADRSYSSDMTTRYDTAWSAIALALVESDQEPDRADLVRAGWQAIYREVRAVQDMNGVSREDRSGQIGSAPRFAAYWRVIHHEGVDERITEEIAVHQVLSILGAPYRDAVIALAVHDTYQGAADALAITYKALVARIGTARRRARAAWFAPETAPPTKGTDRRVGAYGRELATHCKAGHEWTPENTRWDRRSAASAKVRRCRDCERERSHTRRPARHAEATGGR